MQNEKYCLVLFEQHDIMQFSIYEKFVEFAVLFSQLPEIDAFRIKKTRIGCLRSFFNTKHNVKSHTVVGKRIVLYKDFSEQFEVAFRQNTK